MYPAELEEHAIGWRYLYYAIKPYLQKLWWFQIKNQSSIFLRYLLNNVKSGLSSLGVPGVPWHTQILADQLTLFQPGGTDYAHLITTGTPGFSGLPTVLRKEEEFLILRSATQAHRT